MQDIMREQLSHCCLDDIETRAGELFPYWCMACGRPCEEAGENAKPITVEEGIDTMLEAMEKGSATRDEVKEVIVEIFCEEITMARLELADDIAMQMKSAKCTPTVSPGVCEHFGMGIVQGFDAAKRAFAIMIHKSLKERTDEE